MSCAMRGAETGLARISNRNPALMLRRIMVESYQMLRSQVLQSETFDRLMAVGWEETGALILAVGAVAFMSLIGMIRAR